MNKYVARIILVSAISGALVTQSGLSQTKPTISLDEFMNATEILGARISPDGSAAIIATSAPDWQQNRFKQDLWLWRKSTGTTVQLTHTGHDSAPQWSPNGHMLAFLSDRVLNGDGADGDVTGEEQKNEPTRVWILSIDAGEAVPLYQDRRDAHSFAWSADGSAVFFSTTESLSKNSNEAHKAEWKDVIQWREQERGDVLLSLPVASAFTETSKVPQAHDEDQSAPDKPSYPAGCSFLTKSPFAIVEISTSPDGSSIAFETGPVSHRLENPADSELFLVPAHGGQALQITHNQGLESDLHWSPGGKTINLLVRAAGGSIEGSYRDVQGRIYSVEVTTGKISRLGADFPGSWEGLTVSAKGEVLALGLSGMNQLLYSVDGSAAHALASFPGNTAHIDVATKTDALLFTHSEITSPTQVFISHEQGVSLDNPITAFNPIFAERAQVQWEPYRWKSPDGTEIEGVLLYPPGSKDKKHLRMLTLIHGGPADADGDRFGADWYDWATLAAAHGWLVFRPNYRGSSGYGDEFILSIRPHLVSAPGRDILSGVDSLVTRGIADPAHLSIGGYSYGGYMTNWLITQTKRFEAAVTGAGAVEHAANWGNDDLTWDDAWYLSGTPWEKPELYQSEAALFQMGQVVTPTHIVGGNEDDRVSYFEQVLLERALQRLGIPHELLVFPGENHPLDKDPWHGYIKVREELKWLEKYDEGAARKEAGLEANLSTQ